MRFRDLEFLSKILKVFRAFEDFRDVFYLNYIPLQKHQKIPRKHKRSKTFEAGNLILWPYVYLAPFSLILLPISLVIILLFAGHFKGSSEVAEVIVLSSLTGTTEHTKMPDPLYKFLCWGGEGLAYLTSCYGWVPLNKGGEGSN